MPRQIQDRHSVSNRRDFLKSIRTAIGGIFLAGVNPLSGAQASAAPVVRKVEAQVRLKRADEILLTDMSRLAPPRVISYEDVKGRWRLVPYATDAGQKAEILCVTRRDENDPDSCLVPTVRLPLSLEGQYEVWIIQPRLEGAADAGADFKLTVAG